MDIVIIKNTLGVHLNILICGQWQAAEQILLCKSNVDKSWVLISILGPCGCRWRLCWSFHFFVYFPLIAW